MKKNKDQIIKQLKKKLKDARIGERILFNIIYNDAWDLSGNPEELKKEMGYTNEEYNYLKRHLPESYFK